MLKSGLNNRARYISYSFIQKLVIYLHAIEFRETLHELPGVLGPV